MKVFFLIPLYNESLNIPELAANLLSVMPDSRKCFVFVDDKSTDDTISLLEKHFEGTDCHIITKEQNAGPGDSFNRGFQWVLDQQPDDSDVVVTLEGDNTSDLTILPHMTTISSFGYDLVLASVYAQGGGFEKTNFFRKLISFFANMLFRMFFNIKVLTLSSFYRVYHVGLLKRIKEKYPSLIREKGFICMLEILIKAIKVNARIIEVPMVLHSSKRKGKSKMKVLKNTMSYLRFLFFVKH
ncbi:MAG: glycosyltransferase [Bacteroidetes bacterium]|nr:glycosyltransferase [Bacteroidota bacterium]MBU1720914.1 glycosyltransferase [Bacteroidota bacterium]